MGDDTWLAMPSNEPIEIMWLQELYFLFFLHMVKQNLTSQSSYSNWYCANIVYADDILHKDSTAILLIASPKITKECKTQFLAP